MTETITTFEGSVAPAGRGVKATWWYTFGSAAGMSLIVITIWGVGFGGGWRLTNQTNAVVYVVIAMVWYTSWLAIAFAYRTAARSAVPFKNPRIAVPAFVAILAAAGLGWITSSALIGTSLACAVLCTLPWPGGLRGRLTAVITLALAVIGFAEFSGFDRDTLAESFAASWIAQSVFAVLLPMTIVSMLWWWDIVRQLDAARGTQSRLAAANERLRLANDVHDLQGHHLQVIALQLELARRLLDRDPAAAAEQLRVAERSVDEARDGTRALALEFRGVPVPDELANAADLLRADGRKVTLHIDVGAQNAPRDILGPVIREATTNILKHAHTGEVTLSLKKQGERWILVAVNPARDGAPGSGSGIASMTHRVHTTGGTLLAETRDGQFRLVVDVAEQGSAS